jgi:hypothetical protein
VLVYVSSVLVLVSGVWVFGAWCVNVDARCVEWQERRHSFVQDKGAQELRPRFVPGKERQERWHSFVPDKGAQEQQQIFAPDTEQQERRQSSVQGKGAQELRLRFVPGKGR